MNGNIVVTDEQIAPVVQGMIDVDLNYAPFSSWYAKVKEQLESSNEITETLFFKALEHIGAISRKGSVVLPPDAIYQIMKGKEGTPKNGWYCKKNSLVAGGYIESYGICLDDLGAFEEKYLSKMIAILTDIETQLIEEREDAKEDLKNKKQKIKDKYESGELRTKKLRRAEKSFRAEMKEIKDDVISSVLRSYRGDENE